MTLRILIEDQLAALEQRVLARRAALSGSLTQDGDADAEGDVKEEHQTLQGSESEPERSHPVHQAAVEAAQVMMMMMMMTMVMGSMARTTARSQRTAS